MKTGVGICALALALVACASDGSAPVARRQALNVALLAKELVGRPSATSVMLKVITDAASEFYVEYGTSSGSYTAATAAHSYASGVVELTIVDLMPNTVYYYRIRYRDDGSSDGFVAGDEHRFVTQRARTETFTFDVQSDSHQGFAAFYSDALYGVTMQNILQDKPDFLFDLGDTFSTDDDVETEASVRQKYQNQRDFFDQIGHSSPVFLVLGNHENEEGWNLDDFGEDVAASLPVLGANARKHFFLNPVPDQFYSGNTDALPAIDGDHLRGDYYAFEWGNALFVALDPFWYTTRKPFAGSTGGEKDDEVVGDRWDWTLGKQQYDWLEQTLANSNARFKFVFAHHETGGNTDYVRAGVKGAKYGEWGGYDPDGVTRSFAQHRPGWHMPVHDLFVQYGVSIFFHGHDHIFAKEELDGVVYQECPHAANANYGSGFASNADDYDEGDTVNNSGHLRVTVSPEDVRIQYVRSFLPARGGNGRVDYDYTISGDISGVGGSGPVVGDGGSAGDATMSQFGGSGGVVASVSAGEGGAQGGEGSVTANSGGAAGNNAEAPNDGGTPDAGSASVTSGGATSQSDGGTVSRSGMMNGGASEPTESASTDRGCSCSLPGGSHGSRISALALAVVGMLRRRRAPNRHNSATVRLS